MRINLEDIKHTYIPKLEVLEVLEVHDLKIECSDCNVSDKCNRKSCLKEWMHMKTGFMSGGGKQDKLRIVM